MSRRATSKKARITILGRGRVGRAVGRSLRERGWQVQLLAGRTDRVPSTTLVLLAVPDRALGPRATELAARVGHAHVVLHCAGSVDTSVLAPCRAAGASVGVWHPLISIADARTRFETIRPVAFLSGGARALSAARTLSAALGMNAVVCSVHGPAYHAAAVLAANASAALCASAVAVLRKQGISQRTAERAIGRLLHSVAQNIEHIGLPNALTGPVVRADVATVMRHLAALAAEHPAAEQTYRTVLPVIVEAAVQAGLPRARAREFLKGYRSVQEAASVPSTAPTPAAPSTSR